MAYTIEQNKKNKSFVIHVTSNSTITVAGNNSVSNVAIDDEVLTGATISRAIWGTDGTAYISVLRGANNVAFFNTSGMIDFAGNGMAITKDKEANIVVNFTGSADAYLLLECKKEGGGSSEYLVG